MVEKPITSNWIDAQNLMVIDIRCAQNIVKQFLLTNEGKIGKQYRQCLNSKTRSFLKMIWSAKAHLEALRDLKI